VIACQQAGFLKWVLESGEPGFSLVFESGQFALQYLNPGLVVPDVIDQAVMRIAATVIHSLMAVFHHQAFLLDGGFEIVQLGVSLQEDGDGFVLVHCIGFYWVK